jgi:hypothetical protein
MRASWLQDPRALDVRPDHQYTLGRRTSVKQGTSTIPIPDISTLTMGVPEMVIASKANDPSSPPSSSLSSYRRMTGTPSTRTSRPQRKPSNDQGRDASVVADLGSMLISEGVTPIEGISERIHHDEPVPGIDGAAVHRRPSIGVTRPSDEERREYVYGWTVKGRGSAHDERGPLNVSCSLLVAIVLLIQITDSCRQRRPRDANQSTLHTTSFTPRTAVKNRTCQIPRPDPDPTP